MVAYLEKHYRVSEGRSDNYRSLVVLANPKSVLNAKYAKKEIKEQVIRADQLAEYIRKADADSKGVAYSEKDMNDLAEFFLSCHTQPKNDYAQKYRTVMESPKAEPTSLPSEVTLCPKCGAVMILRKASKGAHAGNEFWGCSNFPKCHHIITVE